MTEYFYVLYAVILSWILGVAICKITEKKTAVFSTILGQIAIFIPILLYKVETLELFLQTAVIEVLVLAAIRDAISQIIPNRLVFALFAVGTFGCTLSKSVTCIVTFTILCLVYCIAKGGLGFGDVKMLSAMALILGPGNFLGVLCYCFMFLFVTALPVALFYIIKIKIGQNSVKLKAVSLPFAPFFTIAYILYIVEGL